MKTIKCEGCQGHGLRPTMDGPVCCWHCEGTGTVPPASKSAKA